MPKAAIWASMPMHWLRNEHPEQDVNVVQSFRPIADLARLARGEGFQFILATSPKPWQVSARCTNGSGTRLKSGVAAEAFYPGRTPFNALASFAEQLKIPYIDLSGALMQGSDAETNYLRYAPRWSPQGHRRVTGLLAGFVTEQIPGPWNSRYFQRNDPQADRQQRPTPESPLGRRQLNKVSFARGRE